jgi:VanZ family protein
LKRSISAAREQHSSLWHWLPAIAWLAVVAVFSTQGFGSSNTGSALRTILRWLHVSMTEPHFELFHYAVRKAAHFTAYGTLSALFFRALRATDLHRTIWKWRYVCISLVICFVTASADEIHQTFTKGRTGNWHDVVLDMFGATFVQIAILFASSTIWAQSRWRTGEGVSSSRTAATSARLAER